MRNLDNLTLAVIILSLFSVIFMPKELSQRQKQFLIQFLDMYQELDVSIHYVAFAKRLDIGNVTAYEMLRLLEKRGLVEAEYHLPSGTRGPGRSEVLFRPTKEAAQLFKRLSGNNDDIEAWEIAKQNILKELQAGKAGGYETLLNDLLVRIPEQHSPLIFMTEMITANIITINSIKKAAEDKGLVDQLSRIGLPGELGLIALAGIGAALTLVEDVNLSLSTFLMKQSGKYQEMLIQLSEEKREQMIDFTQDVIKIVRG